MLKSAEPALPGEPGRRLAHREAAIATQFLAAQQVGLFGGGWVGVEWGWAERSLAGIVGHSLMEDLSEVRWFSCNHGTCGTVRMSFHTAVQI